MQLQDTFQQARGNILRMKDLPSAAEAYNILLQEQRHHKLSKLSTPTLTNSMAFAFDKKQHHEKYPPKSRLSQDHIHTTLERGSKRLTTYFCDHCKMPCHSIQRCYKLNGYPPKQNHYKCIAAIALDSDPDPRPDLHHTGLSANQFRHLLHLLRRKDGVSNHLANDPLELTTSANIAGTYCFLSQHRNIGSIIDSGATNHMCHSISSFMNLRPITSSHHDITIPGGRSIKVSHIGDVRIIEDLVLKDVLFVPQF